MFKPPSLGPPLVPLKMFTASSKIEMADGVVNDKSLSLSLSIYIYIYIVICMVAVVVVWRMG